MTCISNKRTYLSKEQAEEALIEHHIHFDHSEGQGPVNFYPCGLCNGWHFTSKGPVAGILKSGEVKKRITREKLARDWERKLR